MKRITAGLLWLVLCGIAVSQNYVPSGDDIKAFFTTKTLVVLEDNPLMEYNYIIKDIMKKEWTISEYDFISSGEFEEKRKDPQYSFIYMAQVTFESAKTEASDEALHSA